MQTTWIIAANAGRARIFEESDAAEPLREVEDMVNSSAQMRTSEIVSDQAGPTAAAHSSHNIGGQQGPGFAHNAGAGAPNKQYQPAQTPQEHETERFAKDLSAYLLKAQQEGRFKQLVLSASPQFLGVLRANLDQHVSAAIKFECNKDYTHSAPQQLREQLREQQQAAQQAK